MTEQRKPLSSKERDNLDDSDFAYVDSDGERHLPIHDAAHVRAALSRFSQTQFDSAADKTAAAKKIVSAAKGFGIEVDPTSTVGQAAGLKQQNSLALDLLTVDYQTEVLKSLRELVLECRAAGDLQMRSAVRQSMRKTAEERVMPFLDYELRTAPDSSGDYLFEGYACVTGEDDAAYEMQDFVGPFVESVSRNAFAKTLSENPDVQLLENHEGRPLCRTSDGRLSLAEHVSGTPTGLHVGARMNGQRHDVHDVVQAIRDGTYNQMSMAFRVTRQEWDEKGERRWIRELSLHQGDVSIVGMAANPHTIGTTGIRSAVDPIKLRSADRITVNPVTLLLAHAEFRNWMLNREWREGKTLTPGTMDTLRIVLSLDPELRDGRALTSGNVAAAQAGHAAMDSAINGLAAALPGMQDLISTIDPDQSGAAGNTETESANPGLEKASPEQLVEAAAMAALGRARRKAA